MIYDEISARAVAIGEYVAETGATVREAAIRFMDNLKLAAIATHVADLRTCVLHPASTTHRQLNDQQLAECGVSPDLVRFSCGIEDATDLIADIEQALAQL